MAGLYPLKARVHALTGYSAHAYQQGLIDWVKSVPEKPGKIRLVHGEEQATKALNRKLRQRVFQVDEGES